MYLTIIRILRDLTPSFLLDHYRRVKSIQSQGIPWQISSGYAKTLQMKKNLDSCNYQLWPLILKNPPSNWALVDVGANEGYFTKAALSIISPREIYVFEPLPSCYPHLIRNLNGYDKCHIIQKAVGSDNGFIDLNCTQDTKFSSVYVPSSEIKILYPNHGVQVIQKIRVPVVTLDETLKHVEKIGLLKIDVQGYELEVLKGAIKTLQRTIAILIEINYLSHYQGAVEFDPLYQFLNQHNFAIAGVSAPFGAKTPLWADAIFIQK